MTTLKALPVEEIKNTETHFIEYLNRLHENDILKPIRETGDFKEETESALKERNRKFLKQVIWNPDKSLQRRIRSVTNIGTITKAMELVAATKMRRAQELALNSRPYAYAALELLGMLSHMEDVPMPELLKTRPIQNTAFLLMTSDKGLAGSFNGAVIRRFEAYLRENKIDLLDPKYSFVAIGQKAKTYLERRGFNVIQSFVRVGDLMKMQEADPIADVLIEGYLRHDFDSVIAFFTTFVTALRQDAVAREFLPISYEKVRESIEDTIPRAGRYSEYAKSEAFFDGKETDFIIEPSPAEVLAELAPAASQNSHLSHDPRSKRLRTFCPPRGDEERLG